MRETFMPYRTYS